MVAAVALACVSGVVRVYQLPRSAERISPAEMRDRLSEMMVIECPRLLAARDHRRGAVTIELTTDSSARVARASIRRGSGDATFDDLAGGLASQLTFAAGSTAVASDPPPGRLTVLYECVPSAADIRVQLDSV